MAGLRAMVDRLVAVGIRGDLWIDGSFLTTKTDPDDVDIVLELSQATTDNPSKAQANILSWFASVDATDVRQKRSDYACDCYLFVAESGVGPKRQYWLSQFGRDRHGNSKGIAVLPINDGAI